MHILCHFSSDIFCVIFKITCFVSFLKLHDILYNFAAVKGIVRPHMLRPVQGSARMLLILGMWKLLQNWTAADKVQDAVLALNYVIV